MNSSKNNELVSVILVNWNGRKWLRKCLDTLSNQTYKNVEIVFVDNASTDDSVGFVVTNFPQIKVIQNPENSGLPKANNLGVKMSSGKYLLLMNNDTWVKEDFIDSLLKYYKNHDSVVVSPLEKEYTLGKGVNNVPTIDLTASPAYFFPPDRKDKIFFTSAAYFLKKEDYINTKGFDENYFAYYEDVDWFWRMSLLGLKFGYAENVFIYHAGAGSTGKGINYNVFLWRNENALQTILKNYSVTTLIFVLPAYFLQNLVEIIFFIGMLKFKIAFSYIEGWWFNLANFRKIMIQRKWIQQRRIIGDFEIIKKMYWGPAKLKMLLNYL